MKLNPNDLIAWVILGMLCVFAVAVFAAGVVMIFRSGKVIKHVRESWERGQMRTPEGQFKMIPTLDEARKFAGARGEPAYTAPPVILPAGREDAIDEAARLGVEPGKPVRAGWRGAGGGAGGLGGVVHGSNGKAAED